MPADSTAENSRDPPRPIRFVDSWWLPLGVGAAGGAVLVFIILFMESSGTDRYTQSFRTLRLSGYNLCVLLPFLIVHGLCRVWFDRHREVPDAAQYEAITASMRA